MTKGTSSKEAASVTTNGPGLLDPLLLGQRPLGETHLITNAVKKDEDPSCQQSESPIWRRRCEGFCPTENRLVVYRLLNESLSGLAEAVETIDARLQWQLDYEGVQQEWGQLARVVERLLMIAFIIGTIMFAALVTVLAVPMPLVTFWG